MSEISKQKKKRMCSEMIQMFASGMDVALVTKEGLLSLGVSVKVTTQTGWSSL